MPQQHIVDAMKPVTEQVDAIVIGGGMAGLAAADALRRGGHSVALLEAGPSVGGLTRALHVGGEPVEAYYHHVFPQDTELIELSRRLGLIDDLEWRHSSMAVLHQGVVHAFDSPLDLLRFAPLAPLDRVRVGLATAAQVLRRDSSTLAARSAREEARRWYGGAAYELLWEPLLAAKFGPMADEVVMAWLVARIRQRAGARRARGDRLGYLRGSLGRLGERYAEVLASAGVQLVTSARVSQVRRDERRWVVEYEVEGQRRTRTAPSVIAALAGPILSRIVELPAGYQERLAAIPYRAVVCLLLELDRPLGTHYWVNVTDRVGLGCVGIVEHTNLVPPERYGGRGLVYLVHYIDRADAAWGASPDEILAAAVPGLRALQPAFGSDWVIDAHLSRDASAQPVPLVGGPMASLPLATGRPGLFHASLAHVYPHDRGVSQALALGRRVADQAMAYLRSPS